MTLVQKAGAKVRTFIHVSKHFPNFFIGDAHFFVRNPVSAIERFVYQYLNSRLDVIISDLHLLSPNESRWRRGWP